MTELLNIAHPFLSVEDFRRRVGRRLTRLIHRLASKYPQLQNGCDTRRMLLALSVSASQDATQFYPHSHDTSEHAMDTVPSELTSQRAQNLLQTLQRAGLLDAALQPISISWAERGYLAQRIAFELNIEHQWVVFGRLWHCEASALRSGYNRAKDQESTMRLEKKLKNLL